MKGTATTDAFGAPVTNGWGSTSTSLAWTSFSLGGTISASDFQVTGGQGTMSVPAAAAFRGMRLASFSEPDVDVAVTAIMGAAAVGAPLEFCNLMTRMQSTTSYYLFRLQIETSGATTLKVNAPDGTQLASANIPTLSFSSGAGVRMRVQSIGRVHRVKLWFVADGEPVGWQLTVVDGQYTGAGWVGVRAGIASGNTNTKPVAFQFDDFASVQVWDPTADRLPIQVLAAFGAALTADWRSWVWTDITADVRQAQPVTISPMGRSDETSTAQPAGCSISLNNPNKDYSAYNPASPNYPNVRRNTPVWVLVGPSTRFFGYANGFPPSSNTAGKVPVVSLSASGILRRLGQGKSPLISPLRRAILAANPVAYWPMEDSSGATTLASGIPGGQPMTFNGAFSLAADTTEPGSGPLPVITDTTFFQADTTGSFSGHWQVDWYFKLASLPAADAPILWMYGDSGTVWYWQFIVGPTALSVKGFDFTGTEVVTSTTALPSYVTGGRWIHARLMAKQNGSNIDWQMVKFPLDDSGSFVSGSVAGTVGNMRRIARFPDSSLTGMVIGHVAVFDAYDLGAADQAQTGFKGENAVARLQRLCDAQGVPITITGTSTTTMGPQGADTFLNLLREIETTEGGVLTDGLGPGLAYTTRAARYNLPVMLTLDATAAELGPPVNPADDDQRNRNLFTVKRKNGSEATYEDEDGPLGTAEIRTYDDSKSVNLENDGPLLNYAAWQVHLGTVEGFRYPKLTLNLRATPGKALDWVGTPLQGRIDVTGLADVDERLPAGDVGVLLEGYGETIAPFEWTVQPNASPYQPWNVAALGTTFRLQLAGQTLAADLHPGATSLSLATGAGHQPFTTTAAYPADFPQDLDVAGWPVHVTAVVNYLNANPFFESPLNATGWTPVNGTTIVTNNGQAHQGTQSLLVTPDGVTAVPQVQSDDVPAVALRSYTLHGWLRSASSGTRKLGLFWFNSSHTFISANEISQTLSAGVWTEYGPTAFAAPAGTAFVRLVSNDPGTPLATNTWRLDEVTVSDGITQIATVDPAPNTATIPAGTSVFLRDPAGLAL